MSNEPVKLLAISPHPSDPDFGVGGTAARWAREGASVVYAIATNGDKGSSDPNLMPEVLAKTRKEEQMAAAKMLGIKEVIFLDRPDLGLEDEPSFRKELLRLIMTYRPEVVATCDPYARPFVSNRDHRITGRVVLDAVWPYALAPNTYRDLLAQGLKLHKVKELLLWATDQPNYYVDISNVFELKISACRIHQSQIGPQGNPEFFPKLTENAITAGKVANVKHAEAFHRIEVLQRL